MGVAEPNRVKFAMGTRFEQTDLTCPNCNYQFLTKDKMLQIYMCTNCGKTFSNKEDNDEILSDNP